MRLTIDLTGKSLCWLLPFDLRELQIALQAMAEAVLRVDATLDLHLARDAEMAALNQMHMGCSGPTNVLSFPAERSAGGIHLFDLGSLVLDVDMVRRESLLYGQPREEHCLRLLAHGMGHLLGYDHGPEMDTLCERMQAYALQIVLD